MIRKALDTEAKEGNRQYETLLAQYNDPNVKNKSAVDNSLIFTYTRINEKGGRIVQAAINQSRAIGNFKLNWEQRIKKATTGELPVELRKMYLDFIKTAANESKKMADEAKPPLPEITVPQGTNVKKLNQTRKNQTDPLGVL